jgi:hypothetical protein
MKTKRSIHFGIDCRETGDGAANDNAAAAGAERPLALLSFLFASAAYLGLAVRTAAIRQV